MKSTVELTGIVNPEFTCDIGHIEVIDSGGMDILSDALDRFRGKRVRVTITEDAD